MFMIMLFAPYVIKCKSALSDRQFTHGDWKFWLTIEWHFIGNKIDNIMVVREFIILCSIEHHSDSLIAIGNFFLVNRINHLC